MPIIASALFLSCVIAGLVCVAAIPVLMPVLRRYALARPNARSSHAKPTPQGGGIAIVIAALRRHCARRESWALARAGLNRSANLLLAAVGLAILGAVDDIRPLPALLRLAVQACWWAWCCGAFPPRGRVLVILLPAPVALGLAIVAALWFVNLTNFMDGLDWMTVAISPLSLGCARAVLRAGRTPRKAGLVSAALLGALARLCAVQSAGGSALHGRCRQPARGPACGLRRLSACSGDRRRSSGHPGTLLRCRCDAHTAVRLSRREKVWEAHRSHFYQRATDKGWSVRSVVTTVFVLNVGLAALALVAANADGVVRWTALASAMLAVALVLVAFWQAAETGVMKGTVLLTGGSGFVGRALALALAGAGWRVKLPMRGAVAHANMRGATEPVIETVRFPGAGRGGLAEPARGGGLRGPCRRSGPRHRDDP